MGGKKGSRPLVGLEAEVAETPYAELIVRRDEISARLAVIGIDDGRSSKKKGGGSQKKIASNVSSSAFGGKRLPRSPLNEPQNGNGMGTSVGAALATKATETIAGTKGALHAPDTGDAQPLSVPFEPKTDTHWDYVMKEMMWLAADFQSERKRQISAGKKVSMAIRQFHKTKETRRLRELAEAELKRRRLAGRMARDVKGWWNKIERVIAYKQRLDADAARRKAMDKHLVFLVRQTEKYGESLTQQQWRQQHGNDVEEASLPESSDEDREGDRTRRSRRLRRRKRHVVTIEEALAAENASSNRKRKSPADYTPVKVDDDELYGESTSGSGTDDDYVPESGNEDDETTLLEAEERERDEMLRHRAGGSGSAVNGGDDAPFLACPDELLKLQQESEMDIEEVLKRYEAEAAAGEDAEMDGSAAIKTAVDLDGGKASISKTAKRVTFAPTARQERSDNSGAEQDESRSSAEGLNGKESETRVRNGECEVTDIAKDSESASLEPPAPAGTGSDADDDADASDVEDFLDLTGGGEGSDGSDEFEADGAEVDDETTLEAEEKLGREMSPQQEINLLQQEGEMSLDELRALYLPKDTAVDFSEERSKNVSREGDGEELTPASANETEVDDISNSRAQHNELPTGEAADTDCAIATGESTVDHMTEGQGGMSDLLSGSAAPSDVAEEDEFEPSTVDDIDDETTIDAEERLGREMSAEEEISMLQRESEVPIEELRALYAGMHQSEEEEASDGEESDHSVSNDATSLSAAMSSLDDGEDGEEFHPAALERDDETTIEAEERLGRDMSYADEIAMLKREGEMSVEELRAMYANVGGKTQGDSDGSSNAAKDGDDPKEESLATMLDHDDNAEEDEFQPDAVGEVDDETTLEAEEKLGREISHEEELAMLKRESETPIEELREMYANMEGGIDVSSSVDEASSAKRKNDSLDVDDGSASKKTKVETGDAGEGDSFSALQSLQASDERARSTVVSRPYLLSSWVKLREYQQIGLNWLVSIQTRRLNGILADEMGLGKTLQTISLLSYLASYKGIWGPHLVIVPTSCIVNWEVEIKRFCPAFKVLCYYGSAKRRKELRSGWTKTNWHHVIVTSYQLAVQDSFAFKRKRWYYLILDEAQNIKNFQSQRWQTLVNFNTQRRLLLTGTPLQNNLMELWSLLHFLMPHVFRSRKEFSYWFSNPLNNIIEGNTNRNDELIGRLHGIIRPFVLRRLKKDVETQMPGKYEHIIKCQLSRRQMFLYEEFMARSSTRVALQKGGNFMGMMNVLMQLRKVCNHPDLFEPRSVITPFVMEPLSIKTAGCVVNASKNLPALDSISSHLVHALWAGGCGIPSLRSCATHDEIEESQLRCAETPEEIIVGRAEDGNTDEPSPDKVSKPGLVSLLSKIWGDAKREKRLTAQRHARINSWRCQCPAFPYPERKLRAVQVGPLPLDVPGAEEMPAFEIASTPTELLAMRKSQQERADDLDELMKKFVFCVPKAGARRPDLEACRVNSDAVSSEKSFSSMLLEPLESFYRPFIKTNARLTSFFPDKKLVQFDAGKLQTLAELLRERKRNGHRVLIFTQMSKMLDILEAFLNLNGHTYLRLDGSTGVDKRQRLMDRFNNDEKVFCFILSTRSGGLGINLTGADTVVFYDSDWNPAMDAQAQDRAHRIGQTRDVHIYRLVTEHTIEENILVKAKQKRHLDFLVMDEGKFHAAPPTADASSKGTLADDDNAGPDVFTKGGLRDILGVEDEDRPNNATPIQVAKNVIAKDEEEQDLSKEQMERAMASLEDEDDVLAMRGAQKEAAEELEEFDETIQLKKDNDGEGADSPDSQDEDDDDDDDNSNSSAVKSASKKGSGKKRSSSPNGPADSHDDDTAGKAAEEEMEKEFAAWQQQVGMDASTIESSLKPTERYGLRFREDVDPFYSMFFLSEQQRMQAAGMEEEWNVEEIEQAKAEEEQRAMEDGDLLATNPQPEVLPRQRKLYQREKARLRADKKRRKLTGENWGTKIDGKTQLPFWYNSDTGEAVWDKPTVLVELEADKVAHRRKWCAMPMKPLVHMMGFLIHYPERTRCSAVCRQWRAAAFDISFVRHVLPVEMGALALDDSKLEANHFRTIADALSVALPGDTIELGDGHYWVNEPGLCVDFPLRIVGDEHDPSHVVVELSGSVVWKASAGWMEGVTLRRPRIATQDTRLRDVIRVEQGSRFDMIHCVLDNEGGGGSVAAVRGGKGQWKDVELRGGGRDVGGVSVECQGELDMIQCRLISNQGTAAVLCEDRSFVKLHGCIIEGNVGVGINLKSKSHCELKSNRIVGNGGGVIEKEAECCCTLCQGNTCDLSGLKGRRTLPGFRVEESLTSSRNDDHEVNHDAEKPRAAFPETVKSDFGFG